jgi:hypothetical protein
VSLLIRFSDSHICIVEEVVITPYGIFVKRGDAEITEASELIKFPGFVPLLNRMCSMTEGHGCIKVLRNMSLDLPAFYTPDCDRLQADITCLRRIQKTLGVKPTGCSRHDILTSIIKKCSVVTCAICKQEGVAGGMMCCQNECSKCRNIYLEERVVLEIRETKRYPKTLQIQCEKCSKKSVVTVGIEVLSVQEP